MKEELAQVQSSVKVALERISSAHSFNQSEQSNSSNGTLEGDYPFYSLNVSSARSKQHPAKNINTATGKKSALFSGRAQPEVCPMRSPPYATEDEQQVVTAV